jgi:hypothetical protein
VPGDPPWKIVQPVWDHQPGMTEICGNNEAFVKVRTVLEDHASRVRQRSATSSELVILPRFDTGLGAGNVTPVSDVPGCFSARARCQLRK